jgi:hypothetical protein
MSAQLLATVNQQARDKMFLSAGSARYRHIKVDNDSGGRGFDVQFSGPIRGLSLQF